MAKVKPDSAQFAALLTPQGKIISDFIVVEALPEDGGGFFLDCPRALASMLVEKLNFYKLRAKVAVEDLSDQLGVMAFWDGIGQSDDGLSYADPRLAALGTRTILPPDLAAEAAANLGAALAGHEAYDAHRIALGVPRGGEDFSYLDTFPHEADMDQLAGVDFDKGCYVGQEVVSRVEHRANARSRVVPIAYDEYSPTARPAGDGGRQADRCARLGGERARLRAAAARPRRRCACERYAAHRRRHRHPSGQAGLGEVSLAGRESCHMNAASARRISRVALGRGKDPLYVAYHDEEWGVPEYDDRALFEKLILDGFQAGPLVDHDFAQAREFPQSLRRFPARRRSPATRRRRSSG